MVEQLMYNLIDLMAKSFSEIEIFLISNKLEINKSEYYGSGITKLQIVNNLIDRIIEKEKSDELLSLLKQEPFIRKRIQDLISEISDKSERYNILHISDLHIQKMSQSLTHFVPLKIDLLENLKVKKIDFIFISGDIVELGEEDEYCAAYDFISRLSQEFSVDSKKIIMTPGNHDLNWKFTKQGMDEKGVITNLEIYRDKFLNYKEFYEKTTECIFELEAEKQGKLKIFDDEKVLILELNSAWEIDHLNRKKASINNNSLCLLLNECVGEKYTNYFKMCVFHHPINSTEGMKSDFIELLIIHGFKICLHGHIHTAEDNSFQYDLKNKIKLIGAGTFGANEKEMVSGIPLQYNFIQLFENKAIVNTRKKEKKMGAWCADARWNNKEKPDPWYEVALNSRT